MAKGPEFGPESDKRKFASFQPHELRRTPEGIEVSGKMFGDPDAINHLAADIAEFTGGSMELTERYSQGGGETTVFGTDRKKWKVSWTPQFNKNRGEGPGPGINKDNK